MQAAATTYASPNPGANVPDAMKAKMKAKSQEFESFYIYQFLELMQPKQDEAAKKVMNGGPGEEMFRHNLNEQLAKNIAQGGGFGLSNMVYKELLQRQEAAMQPPIPQQEQEPSNGE